MANIHEPRQARSKETQEKLLKALETLLGEKFFEQITIREIAKTAGVSPASVYRRFENKEALLPILYGRFDARLDQWAEGVWTQEVLKANPSLEGRVLHLVDTHVQFYVENQPVIRTLYLYIRLNGDLLFKPFEDKRQAVYQTLLAPIWPLANMPKSPELATQKGRAFTQFLISTINERCLFGEINPSAIIGLDLSDFRAELAKTLTAYLKS